ncbi:Crp/Fnr family transcriptional regulator [Propionivibrio soli]|jgi:CRP-like cAMP-binding protein|uniref:Crp/Fnr family transcriptional regulator n=1 Tax=Propionivibrio soli TaxID=2976531 RepID=UPI0021E7F020|nr:Crp/Fnr family transcriptional regulator [Propionivibrio soli]
MEKLRVCTAWRGGEECLACDGRENAFFAGLPPDVVGCLHVDVNNTAVQGGEVLYEPGTKPEQVWVLRTGAVKLLSSSWDGTPRIVRVLKAGDVAGLEALLSGKYAHTALTVGTVHSCRIPLPAVEDLCLQYPGFQWNLMKQLQGAVQETEQWLVDMASAGTSARVRMARLLLRLRDGESSRIHNFTREELGLMLGIALETASRIIAAFVREKLLVRREPGSRFYDADIVRLERIARGS